MASVQSRPTAYMCSQSYYPPDGMLVRTPFQQTCGQQKSVATRAPLGKGHFVLHILTDKRADSSEQEKPKLVATLEGTTPVGEVRGFPSFLFRLSMISSLFLWSSEIAVN